MEAHAAEIYNGSVDVSQLPLILSATPDAVAACEVTSLDGASTRARLLAAGMLRFCRWLRTKLFGDKLDCRYSGRFSVNGGRLR